MLSEKKTLIITLTFFFLISLIGSILQARYTYDSFHWGLVAQSAIDLLNNKTPYKDIFIHYGFFSTLTQSIILFLFKKNIIYLIYFSAIFYSLANLILCIIAYKFLNFKSVLIISVVIFLVHPFANHPWYNYQFFFLITLSLYFLTLENYLGAFLSGFFISLSTLVYENFLYLSILILLLFIILNYRNKKKILYFVNGYFLPLLLFNCFLYYFDLHKYWIKTFTLNSAFLQIYDVNIFQLFYSYFKILLSKNFFTQNYFFIFFLIFFSNLYLIYKYTLKLFKEKILNKNLKLILFFSFLSQILFLSTLHNPTIFRFSTGPIIGLITLLYIYENFKYQYKYIIPTIVLLLLFSSTVVPITTENNKFLPLFSEIEENVKNQDLIFFKSQIWNKKNWKHLNAIDNVTKLISKECNDIAKFINLTDDAFIYMIANQYIDSNQYLYWYKNEDYYNILYQHYEKNIHNQFKDIKKNNNLIIFFDTRNEFFIRENLNIKNFAKVELPYSYQQKRKIILIPKKCYLKIDSLLQYKKLN